MPWWRRRSALDFAEEIDAHLELEVERNLDAGMAPDDARAAARRAFGNVTQARERFFESKRGAMFERLWRHLRYATRGLVARPGFTLTALITLAFGIGINTALFTVVYSFVFRPLPVRESERVVNVYRTFRGLYSLEVNGRPSMLSYPGYLRLREATRSLENLAVFRGQELTLLSGDGSTHVGAALASCNYFATLYVRMARGRAFTSDECARPNDGPVVVLSHGLWQRQFGADSAIVGRAIVLNRLPFTVIGVAEPGFVGTDFEVAELWVPITMYPSLSAGKANPFEGDASWLEAVGRLRPGVSLATARQELGDIARREDASHPGRTTVLTVSPGAMMNFPEAREQGAIVLIGIVAVAVLVVIMACTNVMTLLLARATARRREIGIRLSLGASRRELIGQLMIESAVLALVGGAAGLLLAYWLPPLIALSIPQQRLHLELSPDVAVIAYSGLLSLGTAFLFGLLPALQATDLHLTAAMRTEGAAGGGRGGGARMRGTAVGVQVATSAFLLVIAALFLRATQRALASDPGFTTQGVVALSFNLEQLGYDSLRARLFLDEMRRELSALPGARAVALASSLPFHGRNMTVVRTDPTKPSGEPNLPTLINRVTGDYFEALGIPIVRGRAFNARDERAANPRASVVSETFAREAWGSSDPIGREFDGDGTRFEVVGVARDVHSVSVGSADGAFMYEAAHPMAVGGLMVVVRTSSSAPMISAAAERLVRTIDPSVLVDAETLDERLAASLRPVQLTAVVASALGLLALLLALVGVYGVVNYGVSQRTREIGIRIALGASRRKVQGLVLRQGGRVVAIGMGVGIALAAAASQIIRSLLFGVSTLDPLAFLGVTAMLFMAAALAVWVPARRAARLDPAITLREE
jgi:predicted permease